MTPEVVYYPHEAVKNKRKDKPPTKRMQIAGDIVVTTCPDENGDRVMQVECYPHENNAEKLHGIIGCEIEMLIPDNRGLVNMEGKKLCYEEPYLPVLERVTVLK